MSQARHLSQRGRWAGGQPISTLMHQALAHPHLISLAAGFVDQQSLPVEALRNACEALCLDQSTAQAALQYGTNRGHAPLREALLSCTRAQDAPFRQGPDTSLDQILVTAGSNQLLHLLVDVLCDPGDIVLCAAPSYFVFLGILRNLGVRSISIPCDTDGMIPASLDEQLQALSRSGDLGRVKALYIVTYHDNPAGVTLSGSRRPEIVGIIQAWSQAGPIRIIEDLAYRELRYHADDLPSLRAFDERGETVIGAHTFSKSFSPGIRVGWGVLPHDLVEPVTSMKGNIDFGSPNLNQYLLTEVIRQNAWQPHIARLREAYRVKLEAMLEAMHSYLSPFDGASWQRPAGGLYVWLTLPADIPTGPSGRLLDLALREGVLYVPGEFSYAEEGAPCNHATIRLSFGVQPPERIREGIAALARAMRKL